MANELCDETGLVIYPDLATARRAIKGISRSRANASRAGHLIAQKFSRCGHVHHTRNTSGGGRR